MSRAEGGLETDAVQKEGVQQPGQEAADSGGHVKPTAPLMPILRVADGFDAGG
jgi:hypothetical protein